MYCNIDTPADEETAAREKAVRNIVRTIIEKSGRDGAAIKEELEVSYKKGVVWWKDERVAEWKDGAVVLKGEAVAFEETFKALMK